MRLIIQDEAFIEADDLAITSLVHKGLSKKCYISVPHPGGQFTAWCARVDAKIVTAIETLTEWDLLDAAMFRTVTIHVGAATDDAWFAQPPRISVAQALELVETPFRILLENGRYDKAFLLAMCGDDDHDLLVRLEREKRLMFIGPGGIDELREVVRETYSGEKGRHIRCWAMFDCDAASPGAYSSAALATAGVCDEADIACHMLQRRAIENYLPNGTLNTWAYSSASTKLERIPKVEALFRLTADQRSHYHMKNGLSEKPTDEEALLFGGVPQQDRDLLTEGFGRKLSDLYREIPRDKLRRHIRAGQTDVELAAPIAKLVEMLRVPHG